MNQQLLRTREQWYSAFIAGDVAAMREIETKSFVVINDLGVQNKNEQLDNISRAIRGGYWFPLGGHTEDSSVEILHLDDFAFIHGQGRIVSKSSEFPGIFFSELWRNIE